jgi:hypothetical protein
LAFFFRGRCDCHGPSQGADRLNEAERIGERGDAPGVNQFLEPPLLVFGIGGSLPCGLPNTQRLQRRAGTAEAWLARHMCLIHRSGEATGVRKTFERFAPGAFVRGCEQDAVNVENGRRQGLRLLRSWFRCFKDGHDVSYEWS